ncbi:cupin domain-containing protein [Haliea sp. E17]|uniref:cupin domain-containing protein n=1 Tax=Haliea sp. E17 TaxID=3401576 RepID=UPI003AAAEBE4
MSRDHVEFVQAQELAWEADPVFPGLERKLLSVDHDTGARTQLQRYPEGYQRSDPQGLACNEEFFVLEGCFYLNQFVYSPGCYGFFPAGFERSKCYMPENAVVLRFFDHEPALYSSDKAGADARAQGREAIPCLDTYRMSWDTTVHDVRLTHLGLARKNLRIDPVTGQRTFLFMTSPQSHPINFRGLQESHPTPEESYQISGDLSGHLGTMHAGAYFWRPPHIPHGPFGTRGGSVSLIRFVEGEHVNIWTDEQHAFNYNPPYQPVLPDWMERKGRFRPAPNY